MLLILLHIICFTKILSLRTVSYLKHINSYLFMKYIKRVKHLAILRKFLLQSICRVNYWILSRLIQRLFNYDYLL